MLFIYYSIVSIFTDTSGPVDSPEVSIILLLFLAALSRELRLLCRVAANKGLKIFVLFFFKRSIKFPDSKSRRASMRACSPSTKPFYPPTIRHSRSQKLMADSLRCRSPSFIAINPFSLPAKIYSGHFLRFYFIFLNFFSNTRIHHMLCSLTSLPTCSRLLPPMLPSPFKRHQTMADGFAGAENVQSGGRFVKRRRCEIQMTFTWR